MSIANYSTTVKTEKTVGEIQAMLAQAGAQQVLFDFDGPEVTAISFRMVHQGVMVSFRHLQEANHRLSKCGARYPARKSLGQVTARGFFNGNYIVDLAHRA